MLAHLASGSGIRGAPPAVCRAPGLHQHRLAAREVMVCVLLALSLTGCYKRSVLPQSEGHIVTPATKPSVADVPPPARISDFVPPPKPAVKPPTYTVVVSEVPVKELLFAKEASALEVWNISTSNTEPTSSAPLTRGM